MIAHSPSKHYKHCVANQNLIQIISNGVSNNYLILLLHSSKLQH